MKQTRRQLEKEINIYKSFITLLFGLSFGYIIGAIL